MCCVQRVVKGFAAAADALRGHASNDSVHDAVRGHSGVGAALSGRPDARAAAPPALVRRHALLAHHCTPHCSLFLCFFRLPLRLSMRQLSISHAMWLARAAQHL